MDISDGAFVIANNRRATITIPATVVATSFSHDPTVYSPREKYSASEAVKSV